jgi:acyl-CoA synthetase (AMP-forming)/AMP-acid ligase II
MRIFDLLADGASRSPDKTAFCWVDRDRALSYSEAVAGAERVAGALASLGVGPGDRVGVFAHNGLDYLLAMFGTWRLGAISALVNVQYADILDYYVNDATPRVLVYTGDHFDTIERHRARLPSVEHYVCFDGPQEGALGWDDLLAGAPAPPPDRTLETDLAHLSYTSGTSGRPKGACLAHEPTMRATRCIAERLRMRAADVSLGPTALSSSYQLVANLLPVLHVGGTTCVMSRWTPDAGWSAAEELGATVLAANPPVLQGLLDESTRRGGPPSSLRVTLSGGGPVPPDLKRAWSEQLGVPLCESYGQSELGGFVGLAAPDDPFTQERAPSCGRPLPDKEVRILDDGGDELPVGELGEICLRGGFMAGYWERPEQTAETLRHGWLHTGDVGYVDAEGYVFMRGRLSERLAVAGEHWYPRDVEELLMRHDAVLAAALVGLPEGEGAHHPLVFVTLRPGQAVDAGALLDFVRASGDRVPPGLSVEVVDAMPMTPTGKISKAELLERATAG